VLGRYEGKYKWLHEPEYYTVIIPFQNRNIWNAIAIIFVLTDDPHIIEVIADTKVL